MPISSGIAAYGTLLKIGDGGSPETFSTVAEVVQIDWSGMKATLADITNHGSVSAFKEIVPTTVDPGQIKLTVNFLPTAITQAYTTGLLRDLTQRNKRNFQLVFPNVGNTTWGVAGYVSQLDIKGPVEGKLQADFVIDISGFPAFA
jgi:hypothetical protein